MSNEKKVRALGINHVVLEVGDLDEAVEFYGKIFDFKLRGKTQGPDDKRHFGFVVDDREPVRGALERLGIKSINDRLNFRDPWGNRIEVVSYDDIQFTKASHVLKGMGAGALAKTANAIEELKKKNMAPEA